MQDMTNYKHNALLTYGLLSISAMIPLKLFSKLLEKHLAL